MRGSSAPGRGLISGGTAPLRGIGRVTGRLRRCLVPAPGCLAPDDPLHASCVTRQYRLPGEKALALEITRVKIVFWWSCFWDGWKRLRSARKGVFWGDKRAPIRFPRLPWCPLSYLSPAPWLFLSSPPILVSFMYIRYTVRAAQRSGQPLPEPRAELAFASDVPGAPLLLHRQV